jgi:putative membrane protein
MGTPVAMSAPVLAPASFLLNSSVAGNLPLMLGVLGGAMYWRGGARFRAACEAGTIGSRRRRLERRRTFSFASALTILVLALQQPMDTLADKYFWAHMTQHVLLIMVVPPLMMLAAPWMRLWRAFALGFRRSLARWVVGSDGAAPVRGIAHALGMPWVAFTLLAVDLIVWHVPAAYDLTLRSAPVHYAEHATFLAFGLLAWGQLIDSPPFHSRLSQPLRVAFAIGQMLVGWLLAILLAFASNPWYTVYATVRQREGGLSAIDDQHLAAGIMWVPASLPWSLLVFMTIYYWLAEDVSGRHGPNELVRARGHGEPPGDPHGRNGHAVPSLLPDATSSSVPRPPARPRQTTSVAGNGDLADRPDRRIHAARPAAHR